MSDLHSINQEQKLYCFKTGGGLSCLGFENVLNRTLAVSSELKKTVALHPVGTKKAWEEYERMMAIGADCNKMSGWRSAAELTPQLIGLEHCRVEVEDQYGRIRRFKVGKIHWLDALPP